MVLGGDDRRVNRDHRLVFGHLIRLWAFACCLAALLLVPAALADNGPMQDEVNAVARKLFCPVCENTPLDVCPTEACQNWREEIRLALMEGKSEAEILDEFATKYGDSVLAQPPPNQRAAWLLPVVFVLAGGAALIYWLISWTRPAPIEVASELEAPREDEEADIYVARLEQELVEWE